MAALYNEIDPYAAQWTRNLINAGRVAAGNVDERSISDLFPGDVIGYTQFHAFAGIAVWSYALRLTGVEDTVDLWTGSCPCQPLSQAGRQRGFDDARHLWPIWFGLIAACHPRVILGEQVASPLGLAWLDLVCTDLESQGYTVRAADTCAAGFGGPHIRQRLYFVAYASGSGLEVVGEQHARSECEAAQRGSTAGRLADDTSKRCIQRGTRQGAEPSNRARSTDDRAPCGLGHASGSRGRRHTGADDRPQGEGSGAGIDPGRVSDEPSPTSTNGFWSTCNWIPCSDGKSRPVEPGSFPLVDGSAASVGGVRALRAPKIRGYGNAICAPQAAAFITANLDVIDPRNADAKR